MDERNPRANYDENGRLMSVTASGEPTSAKGEGYKVVKALSVMFAVFGAICFIGGWRIAAEHYHFNWSYFFGGLFSMMFNFGWAVVMRVCALYMKMHDEL